MFTRAKSKRAKAAPAPTAEALPEATEEAPKPPPTKRSSKKTPAPVSSEHNDDAGVVPRRRSARNSGDRSVAEPAEFQVPKRRSKRTSSEHGEPTGGEKENQRRDGAKRQADVARQRSHTPDQRQTSSDTTRIALPFADTPIIRRNKEMRKGSGGESRRSSLSNRGRRASSLIDSGTSNGLWSRTL